MSKFLFVLVGFAFGAIAGGVVAPSILSEPAPTPVAPAPREEVAAEPEKPRETPPPVEEFTADDSDWGAVLSSIPTDELPALTGSVSGTVRTESGEPLAGVTIRSSTSERPESYEYKSEHEAGIEEYLSNSARLYRWRRALRQETTSGADGSYTLTGLAEEFSYSFSAEAEGYQVRAEGRGRAKVGDTVDFTAKAQGKIRLSIVTPSGEEPKSANIRLETGAQGPRHSMHWTPRKPEIDVDFGTFILHVTSGEEFAAEPQSITIEKGVVQELEIALKGRTGIKIEVVYPPDENTDNNTNSVIYWAKSRTINEPEELKTKGTQAWVHRGAASVWDMPAGEYSVGIASSWDGEIDTVQTVSVAEGETAKCTFQIEGPDRSKMVVVWVYDHEGNMMRNVQFMTTLKSANGGRNSRGIQARRKRDGSYWVDLGKERQDVIEGNAEGEVTLEVNAGPNRRSLPITALGEDLEVRLGAPATLNVLIANYVGSEHEGQISLQLVPRVESDPNDPYGMMRHSSYVRHHNGRPQIDDEGRATLGPVEEGSYELLVQAKSSSRRWEMNQLDTIPIDLTAGENSTQITLPQLFSVTFVIEGKTEGVSLSLRKPEERWGRNSQQPDENGRATFDAVVAGEYVAQINGPNIAGMMKIQVPTSGEIAWAPQEINAYHVSINDEDGNYANAGLEDGDLIIGVGDIRFEEQKQLSILQLKARTEDEVTIVVLRGGQELEITTESETFNDYQKAGGWLQPTAQ